MPSRFALSCLLVIALLLPVAPVAAEPSVLLGDLATRAIYLVVAGEKRLLPDLSTLTAFGLTLEDVRWQSALLDAYPTGPNLLPFSGGDLLRDEESGELVLLWYGRHPVEDAATLSAVGWSLDSARPVPGALLALLPLRDSLPTLHTGDIVREAGSDCLYLLAAGRYWIPDTAVVRVCGWRQRPVRELEPWLMRLIPQGDIVPSLYEGCLLRSSEAADAPVYLLDEGKHLIPDEATFAAYGWRAARIWTIPPALLDAIADAAPLAHAEKGVNVFAPHYRGECTWYVAERRIPPSSRDAINWLQDAQASGFAIGQRPLPGAIIVYGRAHGVYGHVAYIDAVFPDGSFALVDSNICGWECVRTRLTSLDKEMGVLGFVYWRYR